MKRFFTFVILMSLLVEPVLAYSPFDIVLRNPADIAVADIFQDVSSKSLSLRICNVGADMTDPADLLMGIKEKNGRVAITTVYGVQFSAGICRDFPVATPDQLGIFGTESNYFAGAAKLIHTKPEQNYANNKIVKYLSVVAADITGIPNSGTIWTPWVPGNSGITYGLADFAIQNVQFERMATIQGSYGSSTLYNAITANVCNYGNALSSIGNLQTSFTINSHTEYVTSDTHGILGSWNQGECRKIGIEVSKFNIYSGGWYPVTVRANDAYNKVAESNSNNNQVTSQIYIDWNGSYTPSGNGTIRITYPNGGENFDNSVYSNQFTTHIEVNANASDISSVDLEIYRENGSPYGNESLYRTEYVSAPFSTNVGYYFTIDRAISTYGWPSDDYRIKVVAHDSHQGYTYTDWTDGTFHVGGAGGSQADLNIHSIYQQSADKKIVAQVCNDGGSMTSSAYIRTEFSIPYTTGQVYSKYTSVLLNHGQCTTDIAVSPDDLGVYSNGSYSIYVKTDADNVVNDANRSNNSLNTSIYVETDTTNKPDLVVESIWENTGSRAITARICNRGDTMNPYGNFSVDFYNSSTSRSSIQSLNTQISANQCVELSVGLGDLGIYQSGYYTIRVNADSTNSVIERDENNNSLSQTLNVQY